MKKISLMTFIVLLSSFAYAEQNPLIFPNEKIRKLKLNIVDGNVKIISSSLAPSVLFSKVKGDAFCKPEVKVDDNDLIVKVVGDKNGPCEINFEIQVPENTILVNKMGCGNLDILNVQGVIDFKLEKGNVRITHAGKEVNGNTGHGNVKIEGPINNADIVSGAGNIDVILTNNPGKGEIELKTKRGNVTVFAPKESSIRTSAKVGTGFMTSEIPENPEATFKIMMRSGVGQLRIKKSKP